MVGYLKKYDRSVWTGLIWLRIGIGCCECGNEPLGSVKCGEFVDKLRTCQLLHGVST
jgi:hypothetical protein